MVTKIATKWPSLGVGLGFRDQFLSDLFLHQGKVDFLEIIADHYLAAPPCKMKELALLADNFTLIPHGLNLSLGSAEGVDAEYLQRLARLINYLNPPWWSEHISFTRAGGIDIGHLSPLPFTEEALDVLCRNIAAVRTQINAPLILENITYMVNLPGAQMSEAEFICRLLDQTDCGLLLDITNLHINAVNHGYCAEQFLAAIPAERIVQLHFIGGHQHNGILIDSHSRETPPAVWQLMSAVAARTQIKGAVLEWDENLPRFEKIVEQLAQAKTFARFNNQLINEKVMQWA